MKSFRQAGILATLAGALFLDVCPVTAAPNVVPMTQLFTVFPAGGQVGQTTEITISGGSIHDQRALVFDHPGITAKAKEGAANVYLVTVAESVPPGPYQIRVVAALGLSNARTFTVSRFPEQVEAGSNHARETAPAVPLGTLLSGRTDANALDHFKVSLKQGQRLLVESLAESIDSRLDPVLILFGPDGQELDRSRRHGLLDLAVPQDGDYVVAIHDFLYRGGQEYHYRLRAHIDPYLDFILPSAGQPGSTGDYMVYGRNLPGGEPAEGVMMGGKTLQKKKVQITLPKLEDLKGARPVPRNARLADAVVRSVPWRLQEGEQVSNPVFLSLATAPVVSEKEPNNTVAQVQKVTLPCEISGQLYPAGDVDRMQFDAEKGKLYYVEIYSHRLGLETHPFLLVQRVVTNDQGKETVSDVKEVYDHAANIGGRLFMTGTRDPIFKFSVPETGTYRVLVKDLFDYAEANPSAVYRLALREAHPDFHLVAVAHPPLPEKESQRKVVAYNLLLRKGQTWPLQVLAFRQDGFEGDIRVTVDGLPKGVTVQETVIRKGSNSGLVYLTAGDDASFWHGPIQVTGRAQFGDQERVHQACGASLIWNVGDYNKETFWPRLTSTITLGVTDQEQYPVILKPKENKVFTGKTEDKIEIPLLVTRSGGFNPAMKFKAVELAALGKLGDLSIDGKASEAKLTIDLKKNKVAPGQHWFTLRSVVKGKHRTQAALADAAKKASEEAAKKATEAEAAAKASGEALKKAEAAAKNLDGKLKAAEEAFNKAKASQEKAPDQEPLVAALKKAESALNQARQEAGKAREAQEAATKSNTQSTASLAEAKAKKDKTAAAAKSLGDRAKPKDISVLIYSSPIQIEVQAAEEKVAKK